MPVLEKQIENPSVKYAKKLGVKVKKKVFGEQLDRTFYFNGGIPFIVEFKAPGHRLTDLQYEEIKELLALSYDVEVHDNVEEFKEAFDKRYTRAKDACFSDAVVPTPIPERFHPLALGTRSGRLVRRSRYGKNKHYARRFKNS